MGRTVIPSMVRPIAFLAAVCGLMPVCPVRDNARVPDYRLAARRAAQMYGLDPDTFEAQIGAESNFDPTVTSDVGAQGIAQFMPQTAKSVGVNLNDGLVTDDLRGAAKLMAGYVKKYGSYRNALVAYNAGPGRVGKPLYGETANYINKILGAAKGQTSVGGGAAGGGSQTTTPSTTTVQTAPYEPDTTAMGTGLADLLAASMTKKQAAPMAAIADPSFSSAVRYGQGTIQPTGQSPGTSQSSGGGLDLATALLNLPSLQGPDSTAPPTPEVTTTPGQPVEGDTQKGGGTMKMSDGRVIVDPGANRPGKDLTPGIMKLVSTIAAEAGTTLHIGTGTNHNMMTTSGKVSDHWSGNGADIPSSGDALTKLGQEALVALGMNAKLAEQQKGGVFNLPYGKHRTIQVIFNTNVGGNHFNHLHVGVTAKR